MIKHSNKYNLIITSIILIGFILSNWAEYFHHHSNKENVYQSCCGNSCNIEIDSNQISYKKAESEHHSNECSLCKVIGVSSFNFLINQSTIDFLSKIIDFSYYQSINYAFLKILNLKNKSPPQNN